MSLLNDKVIVISGSTRGIGAAVARNFAEKQARVVINGRDDDRVQFLVEHLRKTGAIVTGCSGDISRFDACDRLIEHAISEHGRLDYLVSNAGVSMEGDVADLDPTVFQKVIETNLIGACYLTKASIPHLKKTRGGVVFVSSCAAFQGIPGYSVYCASKMALNGFAESLKLELERYGVYVGIAQVGFTINDNEKTILGTDGQLVPQPARPFVKPATQESVAEQIAKMIEVRRPRQVFGPMGKAASLLKRFAPGIYELVLRRHYKKSHDDNFPTLNYGEGYTEQNLANS